MVVVEVGEVCSFGCKRGIGVVVGEEGRMLTLIVGVAVDGLPSSCEMRRKAISCQRLRRSSDRLI